jgi:hypothetical protein
MLSANDLPRTLGGARKSSTCDSGGLSGIVSDVDLCAGDGITDQKCCVPAQWYQADCQQIHLFSHCKAVS